MEKKIILNTDLKTPNIKEKYQGKIRDVYFTNDNKIIMITTDKISAFDVILPKGIPYKGQILNEISLHFMKRTSHIVKNWIISNPHPNIIIGHKCEPFKIEMIIRGYLSGHSWREYKKGKREICGVKLPDGLKENDKFPTPIITPSTKAEQGDHDEDISRENIIKKGIVSKEDYEKLEKITYKLYEQGKKDAEEIGLILVDTKYEFGKDINREITLIDEIHTPDSSRYFIKETYKKLQKNGLPQKQLSKEFVRELLLSKGFDGKQGQAPPEMTDDIILEISNRYIELYEYVMKKKFQKKDYESIDNVLRNINFGEI